MTAFVILAAGRGTRIGRVGETFHKALVPIGRKAVLSHLIELAPNDSRIIICVGHRASQIRDYIELAHPSLHVTFVDVPGWDQVGGGPGASLIAAEKVVGNDDMVFTSCDTLWTVDHTLWSPGISWAATAPIPFGTDLERWCRFTVETHSEYGDFVKEIKDKEPQQLGGDHEQWYAYTGLAHVAREDLPTFWDGIEQSTDLHGERQVTGGIRALQKKGLYARRINWIDVGDEAAYKLAVARLTGYDFTKLSEATYVLPEEGRVVKFMASSNAIMARRSRAQQLRGCVPDLLPVGNSHMLAYKYVPGKTGYQAIERGRIGMEDVLAWADTWWRPTSTDVAASTCEKFYHDKTIERAEMLSDELRPRVRDLLERLPWDLVISAAQPGTIHGDFNLGNIILSNDGKLVGIDWRQDFGGVTRWGDIRYDLAKLLAGTVVHWDRAQAGDFRPWDEGKGLGDIIRAHPRYDKSVEMIAALSLINSAPLHAAPLDEVLVARGCGWLEELI